MEASSMKRLNIAQNLVMAAMLGLVHVCLDITHYNVASQPGSY